MAHDHVHRCGEHLLMFLFVRLKPNIIVITTGLGEEEADLFLLGGPCAEAHDQVFKNKALPLAHAQTICRCRERHFLFIYVCKYVCIRNPIAYEGIRRGGDRPLFCWGWPGPEAHDQVCRCREHLLIRLSI